MDLASPRRLYLVALRDRVRGSLSEEPTMENLIKILIAIFLPPLSAFLQVGLSFHFLLNIVLTLLGGLPGMVHALWLLLKERRG
ncbi:hypothetical protein ATO46_16270 [Aeromonas schubertii]|nr:hypothetical protein ATO46_16270 [Aeromonas schubertii]